MSLSELRSGESKALWLPLAHGLRPFFEASVQFRLSGDFVIKIAIWRQLSNTLNRALRQVFVDCEKIEMPYRNRFSTSFFLDVMSPFRPGLEALERRNMLSGNSPWQLVSDAPDEGGETMEVMEMESGGDQYSGQQQRAESSSSGIGALHAESVDHLMALLAEGEGSSPAPIYESGTELSSAPIVTNINTNSLNGITVFSFDIEIVERGRMVIVSGYKGVNRWALEFDTSEQGQLEFIEYATDMYVKTQRSFTPGETVHIDLVYNDPANSVEIRIDGETDVIGGVSKSLQADGTPVTLNHRGDGVLGGNNESGAWEIRTGLSESEAAGLFVPAAEEEEEPAILGPEPDPAGGGDDGEENIGSNSEESEAEVPLISFVAEDQINGRAFSGNPDDVISFGTIPALERLPLTGEAWVNPAALSDDHVVLSIGENRNSAGGLSGVEFGIGRNGAMYVMAIVNGDWQRIDGPPIALNEWSHIAFTIEGNGYVKLYRDGLLVRGGNIGGNIFFGCAQSSDSAAGGAWGSSANDHYVTFVGAMRSASAGNSVKSPEEIWVSAGVEGRVSIEVNENLTLISSGSEADTSFDYGGKFEKWLYDLSGKRYFVDYDGNVFESTSDGIDVAEGTLIGTVDPAVSYDLLPGLRSSDIAAYRAFTEPETAFGNQEILSSYLNQARIVEQRLKLVAFQKFFLQQDQAVEVAKQRFPTLFDDVDGGTTEQISLTEVMAQAHEDVKFHNMNVVAAAKYAVENPAWLREHAGDSVALKSNGFAYLSSGGLFVDGTTFERIIQEAARHCEFLGKVGVHFAGIRTRAEELGVNPNEEGVVHNDLQQFLDDIPDWLKEFFEELPAEAQRAFRVAYAGGEYWSGEKEYGDRIVGKHMVTLALNGDLTGAKSAALAYAQNPETTIAAVEQLFADSETIDEDLLAELERKLTVAVSTSTLASNESGLSDGDQSKVISTARSLISTAIEYAQKTSNGISYLKDRISETAQILQKIGSEMVKAGSKIGYEFLELTGESLITYYNQDKNGYFELLNSLMLTELRRAQTRNGVDLNNDASLEKYHLSLANSLNIQHRIFEHSPGNGSHSGKLILIFLGNSQHLGDENAGLYQIAKSEAEREGYEVLTFRVGDLYHQLSQTIAKLDDFRLHPDVAFAHTRNIIEDRMKSRGMFTGLPPITEIASESYSWGGGTHDLLFGDEDSVEELLGNAKLTAAAYIDAVSLNWGGPVSRRPAAEHFWNVYQEQDYIPDYVINNATGIPLVNQEIIKNIRGTLINGAQNDGAQNFGLSTNHIDIDELAALSTFGFIKSHLQ